MYELGLRRILVRMLLLLHPDHTAPDVYLVQPVRLRDRLTARLEARRLDAELARGADPDTQAPLTLRARILIHPRHRRTLARGIERVAGSARRADIAAVGPQLRALAARLAYPGPVAARGVAEVRLLLTDAGGPLHRGGGDLLGAIDRAALHLEL